MPINSGGQIELRTARKVRSQLGGVSDVTLWRRVRNPDLDFPKPTKISGRLYFRGDEIDAWIEAQVKRYEAERAAQAKFCSAEAEEADAEKDGNEDEDQEAAA